MQIGQTMQNRAIEIHDSTLDRISVRDGDVVLDFGLSISINLPVPPA